MECISGVIFFSEKRFCSLLLFAYGRGYPHRGGAGVISSNRRQIVNLDRWA
jgi:hypothetical protein